MIARPSKRDRIRVALKEETRDIRTVDDLVAYMKGPHLPAVQDSFLVTLERMMRKIRTGKFWTDRKELLARHKRREYRMRRIVPSDSLDDSRVFIAIYLRVEDEARERGCLNEALEILNILDEHSRERR